MCLVELDKYQVQSLGQEDPLEEEMAPHSSSLAWRIPRTEEPGRLQSNKESDMTELLRKHTRSKRSTRMRQREVISPKKSFFVRH